MSKIIELIIDEDAVCEAINIGNATFDPLQGFMDSADYKAVVEDMRLKDGSPWTIPVTLDIPEDRVADFTKAGKAVLKDRFGERVAELSINGVYKVDFNNDIKKIFGTDDHKHPGVEKETSRSPYRVGGPLDVFRPTDGLFPEHSLSPGQARERFQENGWKTIVGFQTRNPIHRAHEYLQRIGMEIADGIFIQPLIGWKKADDFSPLAVAKSYEKMLECFYPKSKVLLGFLKTPMRYAGPREAIFHAIIRRNYGCTHFIIGRDHAGVGNYYGKYEAHQLSSRFDDLGIEILRLSGPYHCKVCDGIVTEKTCPHGKKHALSISGTRTRSLLFAGEMPSGVYMRKEISEVLLELGKSGELFCGGGK